MENFVPSALRRLHCNLTMEDNAALGGYSGGSIGGTTIADSSGNGSWVSGLGEIFGAASNAFTTVYRTVNPPKPTNVPVGSMVLNPATGQYVPAVQQAGISSNTLMWIGIGLVAVVLLPRMLK